MTHLANISVTSAATTDVPFALGCVVFLKQGIVLDPSRVQIEGPSSPALVQCNASVLNRWHDGSARILRIRFRPQVAGVYRVVETDLSPVSSNNSESDTPETKPTITMSSLSTGLLLHGPFDKSAQLQLWITPKDSHPVLLEFDHEPVHTQLLPGLNRISFAPRQTSYPLLKSLRVYMVCEIDEQTGLCSIDIGIHNPSAARHPNGHWDLGEQDSIEFATLEWRIATPSNPSRAIDLRNDSANITETFGDSEIQLDQLGSGGFNWDCTAHVNRNGICPLRGRGYHMRLDGSDIAEGLRASPLGIMRWDDSLLTIETPTFWQQAPCALSLRPENATLSLLGNLREECLHELQPGESKRWNVLLRWCPSADQSEIGTGLTIAHVHTTDATASETLFARKLAPLIGEPAKLLLTPAQWHQKREQFDEYGWRHFGELPADHESRYCEPNEQLTSHYNNQYDPVLGFLLTAIREQSGQWMQLADDLARHVVDIDIYRTNGDRAEYNNGLFWHTNHYVDAATSTHRTWSRANADPTDTWGSSGGPAEEHCYTTGLLLHGWLTDDPLSHETVLRLAHWMVASHEGDPCLPGQLLSLKRKEFKQLKLSLDAGNPFFIYRYPLTRGTGNYLVALIDAFEVTGERTWIRKADSIVLDTFGPTDPIEHRDFENMEKTWSYVVFLQSAIRYVDAKLVCGESDASLEHTVASLRHYGRWMAANETPYLEHPDRLEFPNDTWSAQDGRKAAVLRAISCLDPQNAKALLAKAELLESHMIERLAQSSERPYSRIQAILLFSLGTHLECGGFPGLIEKPRITKTAARVQILRKAGRRLFKALLHPQPRNSIAWLRRRLQR